MSHAVVDARGLRFTYPDGQVALDGVDLHVEEGQRVALLGPNGAGKTTFALHLNGILEPSAGEVSIGGIPVIERNFVEIRRRVGMVFQDPDDQLFMSTVGQDVAFGPANLGLAGEELETRVRLALEAVDASHVADRAPHHLSGGERRRAAIATVLAMHPDVLVLDEPSAGVDPYGRRELVTTLDALDITQLVITHDLPFALELCERAVILDQGKVVADGATGEILGDATLLARHRLEMPYGYSGLERNS
jgi:cobalt/nickel transport system ATP-binding protein